MRKHPRRPYNRGESAESSPINPESPSSPHSTDLIIIGAGASGLMAAACAAEYGMRAILVERRHLPGRKLLMCGNNRCNITRDIPPEQMLADLGSPVAEFTSAAIRSFSPADLRQWFHTNNVKTAIKRNRKVYPVSEKADDVLHCFQDRLRENKTPLLLNTAVTGIKYIDKIWHVLSDNINLTAPNILIATGGVSYPKTGSVGDGQKFAQSQKHHIEPYRPGLAGYTVNETWIQTLNDLEITSITLTIFAGKERIGATTGDMIFTSWGVRGGAFVNGCRICSRADISATHFEIDLVPDISPESCITMLMPENQDNRKRIGDTLTQWLPAPFIRLWLNETCNLSANRPLKSLSHNERETIISHLKRWNLSPLSPRPLKEAMTTVGGIRLSEVDPETMASNIRDGLWFAGEVLDIDGPTGGYNLQMAFSTARLAVSSIAAKLGLKKMKPPPTPRESNRSRYQRKPDRKHRTGKK